ncbi:MAG: hypothetical protein N2645_09250 [Clostridia bacterium]|nr:hypothetical protein [Clostridia bacterium]
MKFYVINRNLFNDSDYAYGEEVEHKTGEFEKCEECGKPISMRKWLPPLKAKLSRPSYGDFVFGTFSTFLVSERFKLEYESSGLKGIKEFEKVDISKVNRIKSTSPQPPSYYNVIVERSSAKIDEEKSKFVRSSDVACDNCRVGGVVSSFEGLFLKEETIENDDIFCTYVFPGTFIVTQKFYDFVIDKGFTNIILVPAEEYIAPWVHK